MKRNWKLKKPKAVGLPEIVAFIRAKHASFAKWDVQELRGWVAFHMEQSFVIVVSDDGANIAGLLIARPVMNPVNAFDNYVFDYEGPCLYMAILIAPTRRILRALAVAGTQRFGARPMIAWNRRRDNKLTVHASATVARRVFSHVKPADTASRA